jgi:hypothetical protein
LIWVVTARRLGTWIGAKEQPQVKGFFVRAINDRSFLRKPVETVSAVSALAGISLHRNAPGPGADSCSQDNRTRPKTPGVERSEISAPNLFATTETMWASAQSGFVLSLGWQVFRQCSRFWCRLVLSMLRNDFQCRTLPDFLQNLPTVFLG